MKHLSKTLLISIFVIIAHTAFADSNTDASSMMIWGKHFAAEHGGLRGSIQPARDKQSKISGGPNEALILYVERYEFSTKDGNKCVLTEEYYEDNSTGPNGYMRAGLHCFNSVTGKYTDLPIVKTPKKPAPRLPKTDPSAKGACYTKFGACIIGWLDNVTKSECKRYGGGSWSSYYGGSCQSL